jgi:hypothetical protein
MNVMFFSSINTAEFQPFLAAFIIPVFTLPWVKRCEYILSLVTFGEASGDWKGAIRYSTERQGETEFSPAYAPYQQPTGKL